MERLTFPHRHDPNTAISAQNSDFTFCAKSKVDTINALEGEYQGYDCVKCKNKGFIAVLRADGSFFTRECSCMPMRKCLQQMEASGLSKTIRKQTFENFHATEPWQISLKGLVSQYAKAPEGWLMIGGQPGSGKTHLCTAVCRELETTEDPIGEIAERNGFRDPKMLNQYFREIYGCTPSEKRKFFREVTIDDNDDEVEADD